MPMTGHDSVEINDRSQSLTRSIYPYGNPSMHRSMTSLRSHQDLPPRSKTPQAQASRFGHPGYRPSSPALSDTAGSFYNRRPTMRPAPSARSYTASPVSKHHAFQGSQRPTMPAGPRPGRTIEELKRPFTNGHTPQRYQSTENYPPSVLGPRRYGPTMTDGREVYMTYPRPRVPLSPIPGSGPGEPESSPRPRTMAQDPAPYAGFVQRVKNALEERVTTDQGNGAQQSNTPSPERMAANTKLGLINGMSAEHVEQVGPEDPTNQYLEFYPHFELDESQDLGSSEVHPETNASHPGTPAVKRLTRDLIKAGMDAMSDVVASSDAAEEAPPESINCDVESALERSMGNSISSGADESEEVQHQEPNDVVTEEFNLTNNEGAQKSEHQHSDKELYQQTVSDITQQTSNFPWTPRKMSEDHTSSSTHELNRRTFPPEREPIRGPRPLSMPSQTSDSIQAHEASAPQAQGSAYQHISNDAASTMGEWPTEDRQHAVNDSGMNSDQQADEQFMLPSADAHIANETYTRGAGNTTRVTILPNSTKTSAQMGDEHSHHNSRPVRSSLGTVPESDMELSLSPFSTSESVDIVSSRPSSRNGLSPDSTRRSMSSNEAGPSAMKNFQFPLPDLAEDSQEDASTTNLRMLGNGPHVLRGRGGFKDFRRNLRQQQSPRHAPPVKTPRTYFNRNLKDTHNLPSFDFSRTDLTTKLNLALGFRNSRSLEDLKHFQATELVANTDSERPMSSQSMIRERYRSFFTLDSSSSSEDGDDIAPPPSTTKSIVFDDHFLNEIEQLSIPSVKNLSLRLSELFPTIRSSRLEFDLDKVDEALEKTVQEIRGVDSNKRVQSLDGALLESADGGSIIRRATAASESNAMRTLRRRERTRLRLDKELPPLPKAAPEDNENDGSGSEGYESAQGSQGSKDDNTSNNHTSVRNGSQDGQEAEPNEKPHAIVPKLRKKASLPTLRGSSDKAAHRRDNQDTPQQNDDVPTADVTLSNTVPKRSSSSQNDGRGRSRSSPEAPQDNTMRVIRSMSPGFGAELVPHSDPVDSPKTDANTKQGLLRSLSRKTAKASIDPAIDPHFFHPEEQQHRQSAVNPGDRYPTSALGPPPGLSIDESRSYFSDDSSDDENGRGHQKRRRFTRLKGKRSLPVMGDAHPSPAESRSDIRRTPNQESMVFVDAPPGPLEETLQERPPVGMSKAEFHAKRFVEKLRSLFFKSGEALKSISKSRRRELGSIPRTEGQANF